MTPVRYVPAKLDPALIGWNLDEVLKQVPWENRAAPRQEAFYSRSNAPYTYGSGAGIRTYSPLPIERAPDVVRLIWNATEEEVGVRFEALFMNHYRDGSDFLGWHSDDSDMLDDDRPIAVVTLGAEREIWFRVRPELQPAPVPVEKLKLEHGSMLIMAPGMQDTHQHRIPKAGFICGPRVSFTFRGLK